jgi:hypothetical protein
MFDADYSITGVGFCSGCEQGMTSVPAVAGLLPVRLSSTRCPRKNLRSFGDTTLFEHALRRFARSREFSNLYVAAFEDEVREVAARYTGFTWIQRSRTSAFGEDLKTIYDFLDQIPERYIATVNSCFPFVKVDTYDAAVRYYRTRRDLSMIGAHPLPGWIFSPDRAKLLTPIGPASINSKELPTLWKASHAIFSIRWRRRSASTSTRSWSSKSQRRCTFDVAPWVPLTGE